MINDRDHQGVQCDHCNAEFNPHFEGTRYCSSVCELGAAHDRSADNATKNEQGAIIAALQGMVLIHKSQSEKKALRRAISMVRKRMAAGL